jgi:hypothetical protein
MRYTFATLLVLFCFATGLNAYACTSKDDCQCWCKQHLDSAICSECGRSSGHDLTSLAKTIGAFAATGTYCANPWSGHEGPDYEASQREAGRNALEQCYPFQTHRTTDYSYESFDNCPHHFWGSKATAGYVCAQQ